MSQHIGIKIIDQKNQIINEYDLNLSKLVHVFKQVDNGNYPLVYSIDEYDNTWFNRSQCEIAIKELEEMVNNEKFIDVKNDIINLSKILSSIERYNYVLFIGD